MIKDIPYIQKYILSRLIGAIGAKYSAINNLGIENDLFNYHLQALVKKGLVTKSDEKMYSLTNSGISVIANDYPVNQDNTNKEKFRVNVTTIVIKKEKGKIYLHMHKRKRHPYYGDVLTTGGGLREGEKLEDCSRRTIKEKTGLVLLKTKIIGCSRIIHKNNQKKLLEIFLYVAYSENPKGQLIGENQYGENFWINISEFKQMVSKNRSKVSRITQQIVKLISENKDLPKEFLFREEILKQSEY